jgi:hypothetical protein
MIKDILVKEKVIRRELVLLGVMFLFANLTNVYAIIVHEGQWGELISQFHVAGFLTLFLYFVVLLIRSLYWGGKALLKSAGK